MADTTDDYRPPKPPTDETRATKQVLIVAFQQIAGFCPYAFDRPGVLGREQLVAEAKKQLASDLEDGAISRVHIRFERTNGGFVAATCESSRGFVVNGWKVQRGETATLRGGEILRVGGTVLVYAHEFIGRLRASEPVVTGDGPLVSPYGLRSVRRELDALESGKSKPRVILVHGETGTGKERVAHALAAVFGKEKVVARNVAELSRELASAVIFGVEKGAATGVSARRGAVREAQDADAVLFLDEIGDLPLDVQPALLRFLESGVYTPVGGTPRKATVPVVLATHQNLDAMVGGRTFRADLLARMEQRIELPALRERPEDVFEIVRELWGPEPPVDAGQISADAVEMLMLGWHEENVRGLRRLVLEARKRTSRWLFFDDEMVRKATKNRGNQWWRAAMCPAAIRESLAKAEPKKGAEVSAEAAHAWLSERAVVPIPLGTFKTAVSAVRADLERRKG